MTTVNIQNTSIEPATLPYPFSGVLDGLGSKNFIGTSADVVALVPTITDGFRLTDYAATFSDAEALPELPTYQGLEVFTGTSGNLGSASLNQCTNTAEVTLQLPVSQITWPIGDSRWIQKSNLGTAAIKLVPPAGGTINAGTVDATSTLAGSTTASSPTVADQRWLVTRTAALTFRY